MPQFVQDFIRLLNDVGNWIIGISVVAAGVWLAICWFGWYTADENDKPAKEKKIKRVLIGAVCVVISEAIIKLVLSYFTH